MANESKKDFNKKMNDSKNMPKIVELDEEASRKWGGRTMVIAPPIDYDEFMKKVPNGKLITTDTLRKAMAKKYGTDITCPLTCGIFVNICAWASYQRNEDITPYWRTLKSDGELNVKYPESIELQKRLLEDEGHVIISKGTKNIKYYVKDFENSLIEL
ncbi:MAG: methylated DNA-protein cysteine methyltransferase [Bacilli bacterium]